MKKIFFLFGSAALLASCGQEKTEAAPVVGAVTTANVDAARAEIESVDAAFMKSYPAGDSAAVTALYHSEAQIFPPNMPALDAKGMGGVSKYFAAMKPHSFDVKNSEMVALGDCIMTSGKWTATFGDKNQKDNGKFLVIWKQEGGHWKMYRDMWSSDNGPM
jgi:ketosteroid isomerase-like protein